MRVSSLAQARKLNADFDKIVLTLSYGSESLVLHYGSLGLGNLLSAHVGALMVDPAIPIVGYHPIRIEKISTLLKGNVVNWYARTTLGRIDWHTARERRAALGAPEDTWLDRRIRTLFLSTSLVNEDPDYFSEFASIDSVMLRTKLRERWGVIIPNSSTITTPGVRVGIHVRMGDFKESSGHEHVYRPNTRVPASRFIEGIERLKALVRITSITIYSDGRAKGLFQSLSMSLAKQGTEVLYYPTSKGPIQVLNSMLAQDHLLISNSTLSLWAAILNDKKKHFYLLNDVPYGQARYMPNLVPITGSVDFHGQDSGSRID